MASPKLNGSKTRLLGCYHRLVQPPGHIETAVDHYRDRLGFRTKMYNNPIAHSKHTKDHDGKYDGCVVLNGS